MLCKYLYPNELIVNDMSLLTKKGKGGYNLPGNEENDLSTTLYLICRLEFKFTFMFQKHLSYDHILESNILIDLSTLYKE